MTADAGERLRAAASSTLLDEDGSPVDLDLRPGLTDTEISGIREQYSVPLPEELVRLMSFTRCST